MNTSDIRDIERILDLYKTNNLNYAGKKIVDTNELLILLLSKINNFTKKKQIESLQDLVLNFLLKESSTCSKDRIPNYIDNEILNILIKNENNMLKKQIEDMQSN